MARTSRTIQKYKRDAGFLPLSAGERIALKKLCQVASRLDNWQTIPATSSNFSMRCANKESFHITRSGLHKRLITPEHFIRLKLSGEPLSPFSPKASDETLLHSLIYQKISTVGVVLHCHAPAHEHVTSPKVTMAGHELLKALGVKNHTTPITLPVYENSQDMAALSAKIGKQIEKHPDLHEFAFILQQHGIYCYGATLEQALARLEAILHLLDLQQKKITQRALEA